MARRAPGRRGAGRPPSGTGRRGGGRADKERRRREGGRAAPSPPPPGGGAQPAGGSRRGREPGAAGEECRAPAAPPARPARCCRGTAAPRPITSGAEPPPARPPDWSAGRAARLCLPSPPAARGRLLAGGVSARRAPRQSPRSLRRPRATPGAPPRPLKRAMPREGRRDGGGGGPAGQRARRIPREVAVRAGGAGGGRVSGRGGAARRGPPSASRVKCLAGSPAVPATGRPMESAPADVTALPAANPRRAPRGAQSPHGRRAPPRPAPGPGQPPAAAVRGEVLVADPQGGSDAAARPEVPVLGGRGGGCVRQQPSRVSPQRPRGPRWEPVPACWAWCRVRRADSVPRRPGTAGPSRPLPRCSWQRRCCASQLAAAEMPFPLQRSAVRL